MKTQTPRKQLHVRTQVQGGKMDKGLCNKSCSNVYIGKLLKGVDDRPGLKACYAVCDKIEG